MPQLAADRNLLFGMLALQMEFLNRDQLIAGMQAWVLDKSKSLSEILAAQNTLPKDKADRLESLVEAHLARHGNDLEKSLAALSSIPSIKEDLESIHDPDVQASLVRVASASATDIDIYATVAPAAPAAPATLKGNQPTPLKTPVSAGNRFRILRPHARGGLGEVFVARDEELNREVALKEIQDRQADNVDSRSRFMIEAEITGGLEHPGIVPVYGLGAYADGRPYYAMRFIRGDSLKEAIEAFHKADAAGMEPGQRTLELRGLLGRFVDVCNAIAYAHSRGILHRDLKPGNIMLGKYGETLVVDWGLAKPMGEPVEQPAQGSVPRQPGDGSLIPSSLSSASQTVVGEAVGTPQYMSPEQAAGQLDKLSPASDVYSLGATLFCLLTGQPPIAEADIGTILEKVKRGDIRKPRALKADLSPALEAVCLKALALAPGDRYATPRPLADDIEHWLADEPVSAWPEPFTVKARRWIGRHRTLVTGIAASVVVALVGLIVATVLLTAANERERKAKEFALEQKAIAEHNFQLARSSVDRYHTDVSENVLLNEPGQQPLRKKLLENAREFYDKFVKERGNDKGLQGELGRATFRLAQITAELDSETEAIKLHLQAVKRFESLTAEQTTADYQSDLAGCCHHLGRLYRLTDQIEPSEASYRKALGLWERLVKEHPKEDSFRAGLAESQMGLGNAFQFTRRLEDAEKIYQQSLDNWKALADANPKVARYQRYLAVGQSNLATIYSETAGREPDAEKALRAALAIQARLTEDAPNISQYQNDLAKAKFLLGEYKDAAKIWQELVDRHPAVTDGHKTLAEAYTALADVHRFDQDLKKAEEASQRALKIKRKLAAGHPDVPSYRGDLARGLYALGEVLRADTRLADAEKAFLEGASIQEKLVRDLPRVPLYQGHLARTYNSLGLTYAADNKGDKALATYDKAISLWKTLMTQHAGAQEYALGHAATCFNLGNLDRIAGNPKGAVDWYTRAVDSFDAKNPRSLTGMKVKNSLLNAHRMRAESFTQLSRHAEALQDWERTFELSTAVQKPVIQLFRATALARAGKYKEATREANDLLPKARSGDALYRFACIYALSATAASADAQATAEERMERAEKFELEAVRLLGMAVETGFFKVPANQERLKTDPDLQAVRARPDFMKLAIERKSN